MRRYKALQPHHFPESLHDLWKKAAPAGWFLSALATVFGERRTIMDNDRWRVVAYWWRGDLWLTRVECHRITGWRCGYCGQGNVPLDEPCPICHDTP